MAVNFDIEARAAQSRRHSEAAIRLLDAALFKEGAALYWLAVRDNVFGWLEKRGVVFDSTRAAMVAVMKERTLREIGSDLTFAYTVGTMAEWDEDFFITDRQALQYKDVCEILISRLNG